MECIGVIFALIAKWYKSSCYSRYRCPGYVLTLFVAAYFAVYFFYNDLWWLMIYNIINVCIAIRGIRNNRGRRIEYNE